MSIFDILAGQDSVVTTLRCAQREADRIVRHLSEGDSSDMTHAWLFTGPPGSGRSIAARCFAAALQDPEADTPGGEDRPLVRQVMTDHHPDVMVVNPSGLSLAVGQIRDVITRAASSPSQGRWQVVIIEDADRLTEQAGNALLKAVEEPSPRTVFMLCAPSDDPGDIMVTLRSRSRHVYVPTPSREAVADILQQTGVTRERAEWAASVTNGHIGRAKHLLSSPESQERRAAVVQLGKQTLHHPSMAYNAAVTIVQNARTAAIHANKERSERETEELKVALGAGGTGKRVKKTVPRGSAGALKDLEDRQKRRNTRMMRDSIDLSLTDLVTIYRDGLMRSIGTQVPMVNVDAEEITRELGDTYTPESLLSCMEAVMKARQDIQRNVRPETAVTGMIGRIAQCLNEGRR